MWLLRSKFEVCDRELVVWGGSGKNNGFVGVGDVGLFAIMNNIKLRS